MKIYIFDLDNTLIYTDLLNNQSYNEALKKLKLESITDCKRITREVVFCRYPDLKDGERNQIILLKQKFFINNLNKTFPNMSVLKVLESQNIESCILWTTANKDRVFAVLEYYKIYNRFKKVIFSSKLDVVKDIDKICKMFECSFENLIFYEDNQRIIRDLMQLNLNVISILFDLDEL